MRNRSKLKRKTVANSTSFDSFNELAETSKDSPTKPNKPLTRNNSLDENMLPALQKFAAAVRNRNKHDSSADKSHDAAVDKSKDCSKCGNNIENDEASTPCVLRDQTSATKSPVFSYKALKERSKSVPRIGFTGDDLDEESNSLRGSKSNLDERKSKSVAKSVEIKQYNHKTIPKRIATLKKQRFSCKKETSKFYMDLSEFESTSSTILKITESTEDLLDQNNVDDAQLCETQQQQQQLPDVVAEQTQQQQQQQDYEKLTPAEKAKRDAQIILDLLKNNKEFERIYNKPQKKRENGAISTPTSPIDTKDISAAMAELPPRPPSRSPPPLESESETQTIKQTLPHASSDNANDEDVDDNDEDGEPIYESLLRNVHVPYKFSPVLGRSKSAQYYKARDKQSPARSPPRPESDYVTLVYSPDGVLQKVGDDAVVEREPQLRQQHAIYELQRDSTDSTSSSSSATVKRDSQQTVINVECSSSGNISQASSSNSNTCEAIYARPIPKNLMKRLLSSASSKTSLENVSNSESSLLPRALKSIDNITLAFGRTNRPPERRVSDVTEMCRQSILHRQGSEAVGERMAHVDYADPRTLFNVTTSSEASLQRDSFFSLTSSNDSVCDHKKQQRSAGSTESSTHNFEYEKDVEACLENDFRDSAIYSDDNNEKRIEYDNRDTVKRPTSPPPPPPPARQRNHPQVPPKPTAIPPIKSPVKRHDKSIVLELNTLPGVIVCPPHMSEAASRSWVLKQIENFNK